METTREYVGFWKRVGATLLDCLIYLPIIIIYMKLHKNLFSKSIFAYSLYTIALYGIMIFFIVKFGGTPGKLILKYRIICNGEKMSILRAMLRNIFYILNSILFIVSNFIISDIFTKTVIDYAIDGLGIVFIVDVLFIAFSKEKRALHDLIANTYVVRKR